jgi:hypothetical protein
MKILWSLPLLAMCSLAIGDTRALKIRVVVEGAGDGAFGVGEASEGFDGPGVSLSIAAV